MKGCSHLKVDYEYSFHVYRRKKQTLVTGSTVPTRLINLLLEAGKMIGVR